jgi:hypothetical protein
VLKVGLEFGAVQSRRVDTIFSSTGKYEGGELLDFLFSFVGKQFC